MNQPQHTLPRSTWVLVALLTLGWGFNWPIMKVAVAEIPIWTFRAICAAAGAAGIFAVAAASRMALLPPREHWQRLAVTSMFNVTLWNVLIAYGLTVLPAGRSVILAYTMPLWVVLLSRLVLGERLTRRRTLGVALGMAGMAVLIGHELAMVRAAPLGALAVVGAAFAWAVGTVLMKRYPTRMPTTSFTGWQMVIGGIPLAGGAVLIEHGAWHVPSAHALAALAYNIAIAFVFCYWAWYKIVSRASAAVSALGTLMVPIVGVLSSMVLLRERPAVQEYLAMTLVIAAIATVVVPARWADRAPKAQTRG